MSSQTAWSASCVQKPCLRKEQQQMKAEIEDGNSRLPWMQRKFQGSLDQIVRLHLTIKHTKRMGRSSGCRVCHACVKPCAQWITQNTHIHTHTNKTKKSGRKDRRMFDKMSKPNFGKTIIRVPRTRQAWWHMPVFTSVS